MALKRILGIAGVPLDEPYKARVWGKRFEHGLLFVFLLLIIRWYLEEQNALNFLMIRISSWIVWAYFVAELVVCSALVKNRLRYLQKNWLNWIIIIFGFPVFDFHSPYFSLIRLLQILLFVRLSKGYIETSIKALARRHWLSTMGVLLSIVIISALVLSLIDPTFKHMGDGLWFAWESMTTVGYGDYVPHTLAGKLFSSLIIFLGVILISMMTASFAALVMHEDDHDLKLEEIKEKLNAIQNQLNRIEGKRNP